MSYFDGFVAAGPTAHKQAYSDHAEGAWKDLFKDMGALSMVETWGDDVLDAEVTSFAKAVRKKDDETIVFSWV